MYDTDVLSSSYLHRMKYDLYQNIDIATSFSLLDHRIYDFLDDYIKTLVSALAKIQFFSLTLSFSSNEDIIKNCSCHLKIKKSLVAP